MLVFTCEYTSKDTRDIVLDPDKKKEQKRYMDGVHACRLVEITRSLYMGSNEFSAVSQNTSCILYLFWHSRSSRETMEASLRMHTPSIFSTTSAPCVTLPKTVCFMSSHGHGTVVMKN